MRLYHGVIWLSQLIEEPPILVSSGLSSKAGHILWRRLIHPPSWEPGTELPATLIGEKGAGSLNQPSAWKLSFIPFFSRHPHPQSCMTSPADLEHMCLLPCWGEGGRDRATSLPGVQGCRVDLEVWLFLLTDWPNHQLSGSSLTRDRIQAWQWKHQVLIPELPGNSQVWLLFNRCSRALQQFLSLSEALELNQIISQPNCQHRIWLFRWSSWLPLPSTFLLLFLLFSVAVTSF